MTAAQAEVGRDDIVRLLHAFYPLVRADPELGRLFASEIRDWDAYLEQMTSFWFEALGNGPGHPAPSPPGLVYGLNRTTLGRWRTLFTQATGETLSPAQAERMRTLAQQVTDLQVGL